MDFVSVVSAVRKLSQGRRHDFLLPEYRLNRSERLSLAIVGVVLAAVALSAVVTLAMV